MDGQTVRSAGAAPGALRAWLLARDWQRVMSHFGGTPPATADEFEARALATMALRPGADGARLALPDLQNACTLQPRNPLLAANLIQALGDAGRAEQACALSTRAVQQWPGFYPLLDKHGHALAALAQWEAAREATGQALAAASLAGMPALAATTALAEELASRWWHPITLAGVSLRLPQPADAGFLAHVFGDDTFMARFHRFQDADAAAVDQFIGRASRRPSQARRCEWVVCGRAGEPIGLAGLVDIEPGSRRAELLVGLQAPDASGMAALKASLAVMQFGFTRLGLRKLTSYVYADNAGAQANTLHLGFAQEGFLREHVQTRHGVVGLYTNGLLRSEFEAHPMLQRMLARWQH